MAPYGSKSKARKAKAAASSATSARTLSSGASDAETNRLTSPQVDESSQRTTRASAGAKGGALSSLEEMIADLKLAVQERDRYRATLEKIAELIKIELSR